MPDRRPPWPLSAALVSAALGCSPAGDSTTTSPAPSARAESVLAPAARTEDPLAAPAVSASAAAPATSTQGSAAASAAPAASPAPASAAPASAASAAPAAAASGSAHAAAKPAPARPCGATHVVAAGETLRAISAACYGSHAYLDLLRKKNGLKSATVKAGDTLKTPPLRDLVACGPREVCEPLFAAYAAFRKAQDLGDHSGVAPAASFPHLDRARQLIEAAVKAAEAKKLRKPLGQLKSALDEIATLRGGKKHEPGYPEHAFHQHVVFALERLAP